MSSDRGSITLWVLGLVVVVIGLGAVAIDLWRVLATRVELAALVESAAVAGASGIDEDHLRATGEPRLIDEQARRRVGAVIADDRPDAVLVEVAGDTVVVTGERSVPLGLLRIVVPDDRPITVRVSSEAVAAVRP